MPVLIALHAHVHALRPAVTIIQHEYNCTTYEIHASSQCKTDFTHKRPGFYQ